MQTLTDIVVEVARRFRDTCFPPEWKAMPVEASWGRISCFQYRRNCQCNMGITKIRFGSKCVEDNATKDPAGRRLRMELAKIGLLERFGGSPAVLLAALICHEFSHAWINYTGLQRPHHVHDSVFYDRMGWMMDKWGEDLSIQIAELGGAHLLNEPESVKVAALAPSPAPMQKWSKGDKVSFVGKGVVLQGLIIESRGRGRVKVGTTNPDGTFTFWKVPRYLLTKIS